MRPHRGDDHGPSVTSLTPRTGEALHTLQCSLSSSSLSYLSSLSLSFVSSAWSLLFSAPLLLFFFFFVSSVSLPTPLLGCLFVSGLGQRGDGGEGEEGKKKLKTSHDELLCMRKSEDVTIEEYATFHRALLHVMEDHLSVKHFGVEDQLEFQEVLFVPQRSSPRFV